MLIQTFLQLLAVGWSGERIDDAKCFHDFRLPMPLTAI
jgi:hypothetical protein